MSSFYVKNGICKMEDDQKHLQKNLIKTQQMYVFQRDLCIIRLLKPLKLQSLNFLADNRLVNNFYHIVDF